MSVFLLLSFVSCQPVVHDNKRVIDQSKLSRISWLTGTWQMQTPAGVIVEQWVRDADTQWLGSSYMITPNGDTGFSEHIRLHLKNGQLTYLPVVSNQNEGKEVAFREKSFSDSVVVFENTEHDFPQRISYKKVSDTSILAVIEGVQNGQGRREEFAYYKK